VIHTDNDIPLPKYRPSFLKTASFWIDIGRYW